MNTKLGRRKYLTREGGSPHSCSALYVDVTVTTVMMVSAVRGPQCNTPGIASWVEVRASLVPRPPPFFVRRASVYYTERKPKNKKRGRPGNEARSERLWAEQFAGSYGWNPAFSPPFRVWERDYRWVWFHLVRFYLLSMLGCGLAPSQEKKNVMVA